MPYKDPEKKKEYRRRWYSQNQESEKAHVKKRKRKIRSWFQEYKINLKCSICNENHPATIDFHHSSGKKEQGVSKMVAEGYSIKKIKKELNKCEILCANCHRKKHYKSNKHLKKFESNTN